MAQLLQLHFIHMDASWGRWRLNTQHRHEHMAAELASWLPVRPSHAAYREELLSFAVESLQDATIALQAVPHAELSELAGLAAELASARSRLQAATNHQRSCSASHSSPSSVPACAASVLAHAPERGTQAGELLLQTRSGPATGTCSEADDGDDASEADDVAARQFAGLTRLQLDEVGRERQVQQQGRQRAEAPAERSVEIAQAMVPLAGALARGGG